MDTLYSEGTSRHHYHQRTMSPTHEDIRIILVHGFEQEDYGASLEKWVKQESQGPLNRVVPFSFSAKSIMVENTGPVGRFGSLRKQVYDLVNAARVPTGDLCQGLRQNTEGKEVKSSLPFILWISHGLGTWLVKDFLIRSALINPTIKNMTIGAIFLDSPDPTVECMDTLAYLNLLRPITQKKGPKSKSRKNEDPRTSSLANKIEIIDDIYLTLCSEENANDTSETDSYIGWSHNQQQYMKIGLPYSLGDTPKKKREVSTIAWYHKGKSAISLPRALRFWEENKTLTLDKHHYVGDTTDIPDFLSKVELRHKINDIIAQIHNLHRTGLNDPGTLFPKASSHLLYHSDQMSEPIRESSNNRHFEHEKALAKLLSELLSVTQFEHYMEAMSGFLDDELLQLKQIKQKSEELNNFVKGEFDEVKIYPKSRHNLGADNSMTERVITQVENRIQSLKTGLPSVASGLYRSPEHSQRLRVEDCRSQFGAVIMKMIYGDYSQALEALEPIETAYKSHFMPEHILRLEASSFRALLLALNSKPMDAERLCRRTIAMMIEERGLEDPMTLITISNLVFILTEVSYFGSAMETATSIVTKATKIRGNEDALTLHCRGQLAVVQLKSGCYLSAEAELKAIIQIAEGCLTEGHPDMFRYLCILAKVYVKEGKPKLAKKCITTALQTRIEVHGRGPVRHNPRAASAIMNIASESGFDGFLEDLVRDLKKAKKLHPQLLDALKVCAEIQFREAAEDQGMNIYKSICMQEREQYGDEHLVTSSSLYRLSVMMRETADNPEMYHQVREKLEKVFKTRKSILGGSHVDTLSVRREILKASYELISAKDNDRINWEHINAESESIYEIHMANLGKYHPETLESLLWLFRIRFSGSLVQAETSSNELLRALRSPLVRGHRLIESLSMEFYVALLYYDSGYYSIAREILQETAKGIEVALAEGDKEMHDNLAMFEEEAQYFLDCLQSQVLNDKNSRYLRFREFQRLSAKSP
ncbi:hypothetical protein M434DRAFT_392765 [Hypoxylon sp. CO27-5]|nr:hypothetical protein M434DRAFT_392765 [Hypoxylon sp. CO27-5]